MRKIGFLSSAYLPASAWPSEPSPVAENGYLRMKAHGFDCADYQNFIHTDGVLSLDDTTLEARLRAEKALADEAGIEFYQVHGPWRYPPQDATEDDRAERREKAERALWGASLLGATCLVLHPIMPFGAESPDHPERVWELNRAFLCDLLPTAERYGVTLALENMPFRDFPLARPDDIARLVREINADRLRICLDTGHAACCQVSPAEALRAHGDLICALHVHDNDGWNDFHWQPFTGVIDWADFTRALDETGFAAPISLENRLSGHYPPELDDYFREGLARIARHISGT